MNQKRKPTSGTTEFFCQYIDAFVAHVQHGSSPHILEKLRVEVNKIMGIKGIFGQLKNLGQVEKIPEPKKLATDETPHAVINPSWHRLAMEHLAGSFGRYGLDAVSGIAEAALYANALATAFGTYNIYYRGEQRYGYPLRSRAERNLPNDAGLAAGLTEREVCELRRFQATINSDAVLAKEITKTIQLPDENNPIWLPIIQHYDEEFGTRLLDLSSSLFTGLYFACIGWDGKIDSTHDGLMYVFFRGNGGLTVRGFYYDEQPDEFDDEMDNLAPDSVEDSFKDWDHPEVLRIYRASSSSERELAQDGLFLVKGSLSSGHGFGQGFKFRVPAEAKEKVARELWMAGYTPERIVRGPKGRSAHKELARMLGVPNK